MIEVEIIYELMNVCDTFECLVDITSVIHTFEEKHDDLLLAYVSNQ